MTDLKAEQKVYALPGNDVGRTTGNSHSCMLEGCSGQRIAVKWEDGSHTYPCSRGMIYRKILFWSSSLKLDADSWVIGIHPSMENVEGNPESSTDMTLEHWEELRRVTPKEPFRSLDDDDGGRPMQMPCNWSVDDVLECMIDEMDMSFAQTHELIQNRDLMYEILSQFQEDLASDGSWMELLKDIIEDKIEEDDDDD